MKFVILDEVDYMTKNAEQALRYLLQNYVGNVRFCLICNYISKIDGGLQNDFIKLRFNQLPESDIIRFLKHISESEKLNFSEDILMRIQKMYRSDIRSMINYMQSNQDIIKIVDNNEYPEILSFHIIDNSVWHALLELISIKGEKIEEIQMHIYQICTKYNIDKKNIIKDFLNYIIRTKSQIVNSKFLSFVENIIHSQNNNYQTINYMVSQLSLFL
jgi:DNA polymerase III gamma/tau subunit